MTKKKTPQTIEKCDAELELTQKKIRQYENRAYVAHVLKPPKDYKADAGCTRTPWRSIQEECFWTVNLAAKFLRDERYAPAMPRTTAAPALPVITSVRMRWKR